MSGSLRIIKVCLLLLLLPAFAWTQVTNDDCINALSLGSLPTPNPCGQGPPPQQGLGSPVSFNGLTNSGATPMVPYPFLTGCTPAGTQPAPSADVWYTFTATGPLLSLDITGLGTPNVALYEGTCGSLFGRGCAIGNAGNLSTTFGPLGVGTTYYLQISGADTLDQGSFNLTLQNDLDCNQCLNADTLVVTPAPVNGVYYPGQAVTFCYTISDFTQVSSNWLHGVVPVFGSGWDTTGLAANAVPPTSCDGTAQWGWYNSVTSSATGLTVGPGFFTDRPTIDGNPGNNFGDAGAVNCAWTFCWTVTTETCPPGVQGENLNVQIQNFADGETGSWTSPACTGDPNYQFNATLTCCIPPTVTVNNITCAGDSNGSATAVASGTGPWDYYWINQVTGDTVASTTNGGGSASVGGLVAGTYGVIVIDQADNCQTQVTFTITEPPAFSVAITGSNDPTCVGVNDGDATVTASGGVPPYNYAWNTAPVQTTPTATNLGGGTYTVVVTDSFGCADSAQVTLVTPPGVVPAIDSSFNVTCNGANDGRAYASATGGSPGYTFSWNTAPVQNTPAATGLGPGTYFVTVTDANGCFDSIPVTITEPPLLVAAIDSSFPVSCNGVSDGRAYASASGGTGPYTFSWNSAPVQNTASATGLPAGNYTVTVTDANGCTATANVTIAQPPLLVAAIDSSHNVTCNGANDGDAYASASGGTGPYTFSWNTAPVQNTAVATNLGPGNYTVTVTDANGCTATANVNITEPPLLVAAIDSSHNVTCNGANDGDAYASASGGTGPYTFSWNTAPVQNTAVATNLGPGNYTVTVTDANGCIATANVNITEPPVLVAAIDSSHNVSCNGLTDGDAYASASGGTGPYSFSWNTAPVQNTAVASNLGPGTYTVTVTDANGCTSTANVTITQPPAIVVQIDSTTNVSCNGLSDGAAYASASGGTAPLSFSWNSAPVQNTAAATGLPAGTYTVTVTDANGCTNTAQATITEPPVLVAAIDSSHNESCPGAMDGDAYASASGGTGPYTYSWNTVPVQTGPVATGLGAGTYTVTVTDANGCIDTDQVTITAPTTVVATIDSSFNVSCNGLSDGSAYGSGSGGTPPYSFGWTTAPVQLGPVASGLPAGTYVFIVADANGCADSASVTITEPTPLNLVMSSSPSTCGNPDGQAWVTASGATPGYTYAWNTAPVQTTDSAFNLVAGSYQVVVTDANGCQDSATVNVIDLGSPVVQIDSSHNASCNGALDGDAYASATGGSGTLTYSWNTVPVQNGPVATGLGAGTYTVTVTDSVGCTSSANVTITEPTQVVAAIDSSHAASCNGAADGDAYASASGGTPGYTYSWNTAPVQTGPVATGLTAGTYQVVVTDANGCQDSIQVTITQPTPVVAAIDSSHNPTCAGLSDGDAYASASGGTGPYTYSWNSAPVQTGPVASGLSAGTYQVLVTDANGCQDSIQVTLTDPPAVVAAIDSTHDASCNGALDGDAYASASGGTPGYTFTWNTAPVQTGPVASGLGAGTYQVLVTDANGCQDSIQAVIGEPTALNLAMSSSPSTCGNPDGQAWTTVSGGTPGYTYAWNTAPVQSTDTAFGLVAGTYTVVVTDANGCVDSNTVNVIDLGAPAVQIDSSFNESCPGAADGSAFASATGGSGTLTFSWNTVPVQNGPTATGLSAGTYTVTVTDSVGCTASANVTITAPTSVTVQIDSSHNVSCFGLADGDAYASATGGTLPYTFGWNTAPVQAGPVATGLSAGSYTVIVADSNGCIDSASVTITEPTLLVGAIDSTHDVSCFGLSDGDAYASASGGTGPYGYSWNTVPVQTGPVATGLAAGTYDVVITDANGCTDTVQATINQPTALNLVMSSSPSTCGNPDGQAWTTVSGGTPGYTYAWNTAPVQSTDTAFGLVAGTYTVVVTDANGCVDSNTVNVIDLGAPAVQIDSFFNESCPGAADGSAFASATGGSGTLTFSWNTVPVQNGPTATGLAAGTYTVTVTDSVGCTASANVTITAPTSVTVQIDSSHNVSCFGLADGDAYASATGGTLPYTFGWNTAPVQAGPVATGLSAGSYTVIVADSNGCIDSASVTITEPTLLVGAIDSTHDVSCFGLSDGDAYASASGGTGPYGYSWNTVPVQTGPVATGLAAGTYDVVITDANGCTDTVQATINQPTALNLAMSSSPSTCGNPDGQAWTTVSGGTPGYTYAWNTAPVQSTDTAFGLVAGTYTVVVTDANGCIDSNTVNVIDLGAPAVQIDSFFDASCNGLADGSAFASGSGGSGPLTFSWNTVPVQNGPTATGLAAGTYTVTVTDSVGCTSATNVTIGEPTPVVAVIDSTIPASCAGIADGQAFASASGGTSPYTYAWNTVPVQNGPVATGLAAGSYNVVATDSNGCTDTATAVIGQPASVVAQLDSTHDASCNGALDGDAYASASGGTTPYNYVWNTVPVQTGPVASGLGAGTYQVVVTDSNGCQDSVQAVIAEPTPVVAAIDSSHDVSCNGLADGDAYASASGGTGPYTYAWNTVPVQTGPVATGLAAGSYQVVVTDANGCQDSISVTIAQPTALNIVTAMSPSTCGNPDGQAWATVSGGTPGYSYAWNTAPVQTADTAFNLVAGTYQVLVTDANGCIDSASVNVIDLGAPTVQIDSSHDASCNGALDGDAYASASGGTGTLTFSWNTVPVQNGPVATGLGAGTYTVTVTDSSGCTSSANVTISEPPALVVAIDSSNNISCNGLSDGNAYASASGGTAPYSFLWNTAPAQTGPVASGIPAGTYTVVVTDSNGCIDSAQVTLTEPTPLVAAIDSTLDVSCNGGNNGQAFASASGGTGPYNYTWNTVPVQTGPVASGLVAGTYTVTVVDSNGCIDSIQAIISEPTALSLATSASPSTCGNADGQAWVTVSGGTTPYAYAWNTNPVQTTDTAFALSAGTYQVIVTDSNGCIDSASVTVIDLGGPVVSVDSSLNVTCFGDSTGAAFASASGGTPPFSYSWNSTPNQTGPVASNLPAGNYIVTVTDSNGCLSIDSVSISEPTLLTVSVDSSLNVSCFGGNDGFAISSAAGGTGPYSFSWNTVPVQNTDSAAGLSAGTYMVTVTDSNGCTAMDSVLITEPPQLVAVVDTFMDVSCSGGNDGWAHVSASGGTPGYTYSWNTNPVQTGDTAFGLMAGTYIATVTDSNGCTTSDTVVINEPAPLVLQTGFLPATCGNADGTAWVVPGGGTPGYTYSWNTNPVQTSDTISGLLAGDYTVTVTDSNGCVDTATVTVPNLGAPAVSIQSSTDVSCFGANDGTALGLVSGGNPPYQYNWNTTPVQTTAQASNLGPGTYTLVVVDSVGCSDSATVTIAEPTQLVIAVDSIDVTCFGLSDGSAWVTASGGTPGYTYNWSNGEVTDTISNLFAGMYAVVVTDANGCMDSAMVNIDEPGLVVADFNSLPSMPANLVPGTLVNFTNTSMNATSYVWAFGDGGSDTTTNPMYTYNDPGNYCVTLIASNDNGCMDTTEICNFTVIFPDLVIPNTFTPNGDNVNDVFEILGLEQYPNAKLVVYNRWGNLVYEKDQYNNDWNGTNISNGLPLPDGGYVYIFKPGEGEADIVGSVVIFR